MNTYEQIMTRRSIRRFTDEKIPQETVKQLLMAAMNAPSCVKARDWSFIVVDDKDILNQMADGNGRPAEHLRNAALGILVCGDTERAFAKASDYWVIDASLASENIVLAAADMGLGSVMLGTWPQMERVEAQKKLFGLPDHIIPLMIIALGYPQDPEELKSARDGKPLYEEDRVHINKW